MPVYRASRLSYLHQLSIWQFQFYAILARPEIMITLGIPLPSASNKDAKLGLAKNQSRRCCLREIIPRGAAIPCRVSGSLREGGDDGQMRRNESSSIFLRYLHGKTPEESASGTAVLSCPLQWGSVGLPLPQQIRVHRHACRAGLAGAPLRLPLVSKIPIVAKFL